MTIQTLAGLPLLQDFTTPITATTKEFYLDTLAKGSGPNGLVLIQDFFGASTGPEAAASITIAANILRRQLANGTLANLAAIYANMKDSVNGSFGTDPVIIPSGPGQGTYANIDLAISALVSLARSAIVTAAAAMGGDTATLNSSFAGPGTATVGEKEFQTAAGINFEDLTEGAQTPVLALITGIPTLGTSDASGRPAQFFESVIDQSTVAGQALIGVLREGQNSQILSEAGVNGYNIIPAR
jgi:hypothetical protein